MADKQAHNYQQPQPGAPPPYQGGSYPPPQGQPYPPPQGQPYPPPQGQPYPPPQGQPYPPPQGQPYPPPQGQPYPPPQGQPYPPQGQPYPPQGNQPYPPQGQPYPTQGQPYPSAVTSQPQQSQLQHEGIFDLTELGGGCCACFSGPPGVPDAHELGGFDCGEWLEGCCICFGWGKVQNFVNPSMPDHCCNLGWCYCLPYCGDIVGWLLHYQLRNQLKETVGSNQEFNCVDCCALFCCPVCHMCQELRAIRGYKYKKSMEGKGSAMSPMSM